MVQKEVLRLRQAETLVRYSVFPRQLRRAPGHRILKSVSSARRISSDSGAWTSATKVRATGLARLAAWNQPSPWSKCAACGDPYDKWGYLADVALRRASSRGYPGRSFSEDQARMATLPPGFTTRTSSFTSGRGSMGA